MADRPLSAVVLAAGEGTRMRSSVPKPLHRLCGRPMVLHVLDAVGELPVDHVIVVVGHRGEWVTKELLDNAPPALPIEFVEQSAPRGTGDALAVGLTALPDVIDEDGDVLVVPGDTPLVRAPTLAALVRQHRATDAAATILTAHLEDPVGCDRVVRGRNQDVIRIVGEDDLADEERGITEVATTIACYRHNVLAPALRRLRPGLGHAEHCLSGVPSVLHDAGYLVASLSVSDPMEAAGVNDRAQLAIAEAELRDRINERWMRRGVTMSDPERTYVDASVRMEPEAVLLPGTVLQGDCVIGAGAEIGPEAHLVDTVVGEGAVITRSSAERAEIGPHARIGPFAVVERGARVAPGEVVGPHSIVSAITVGDLPHD